MAPRIRPAALLLLAAGCGGSPAPRPATGAGAAATAAPAGRDANLAYWNGMNSVPAQVADACGGGGPGDQARAFRRGAAVIRQNPTLGIDPDLVAWALRAADLLERRADLTAQSRDPALLAEAFARGWGGDPFGAAVELSQAERGWAEAFRAHKRDWNRLRAALTARHGVEFP